MITSLLFTGHLLMVYMIIRTTFPLKLLGSHKIQFREIRRRGNHNKAETPTTERL